MLGYLDKKLGARILELPLFADSLLALGVGRKLLWMRKKEQQMNKTVAVQVFGAEAPSCGSG